MRIEFFDNEGVLHHDFVLAEQTVKDLLYVLVLKRLKKAIRRKRPANWQERWSLYYNNALSHTSIVVQIRVA